MSLRPNKIEDPVFGTLQQTTNGWVTNTKVQILKYPVQICLPINRDKPNEFEQRAFLKLKEEYSELMVAIYDAIFKFWENHRVENETEENSSQSFPHVKGFKEMSQMATLFIVEIAPDGKEIKLFYEFGFHSEYVFAVRLVDFAISDVSFS